MELKNIFINIIFYKIFFKTLCFSVFSVINNNKKISQFVINISNKADINLDKTPTLLN